MTPPILYHLQLVLPASYQIFVCRSKSYGFFGESTQDCQRRTQVYLFFDKVIYVVTWNFIATFDIREAENQQNQLSWQNFQEVMFVYILNRKTEYTQLAVWYTFSKLQWNDVAHYHYAIIISVQKLTLVIKSNTTGFLRIQKDNRKILKNL